MYRFAASMMCMDLLRFGEQASFLDGVAAYFHVDIMDAHFVPNLTLSPYFISELKRAGATAPIDSHLMVERPDLVMASCVKAGSDMVSLHIETLGAKAFRFIDVIRDAGATVGLVFNPETPIVMGEYYLELARKITVMTVDPGFSGGRFIPQMLRKIEALRELRERRGLAFEIEVDGACNSETFADLAHAGAEVFVMGNTGLFRLAGDLPTAWARMLENFSQAVGTV